MASVKVKKVCKTYKQETVVVDAWAKWNPDTQEHELENTFDFRFCTNCEGETTEEDVEIPA